MTDAHENGHGYGPHHNHETDDMDEKRRRTRVNAGFETRVFTGGETYALGMRDVSLKGVRCAHEPGLAVGMDCVVELALSPEARIEIEGVVVRSDADGTAIDFGAMDEDSFSHLRRLVQYNAADPDEIDRELRDRLHSTLQD